MRPSCQSWSSGRSVILLIKFGIIGAVRGRWWNQIVNDEISCSLYFQMEVFRRGLKMHAVWFSGDNSEWKIKIWEILSLMWQSIGLVASQKTEASVRREDWGHLLELLHSGNRRKENSSWWMLGQQSFGLSGRRQGWYDLREQHWNMYITICKTDDQNKFNAWNRAPKGGALGQPRGIGWGGRREGHVYTCVHLWLIHVDVWQKPSQCCKVIILQLK